MTETAKRLLGLLGHGDQASRLSRWGMPDGFFLNDVLWFGDAGCAQVAVSRGFVVEPAELDALDEAAKADLIERLRVLLATLGQQYALQVRFQVVSDYFAELERYRKKTDAIQDRWRYRWQVWNRTERHARYKAAMDERKLRREMLTLFFTRIVDALPRFSLSDRALARHFEALAKREALAFEEVQLNALSTIFPDARVRMMGDREHYLHYYRFFNPSVGFGMPPEGIYDDGLSIQGNCLWSDVIQPPVAGVSFQLDGFNHAVVAMTELPHRAFPGMVSWLTNLGFVDFELVLNLYPQAVDRVVKQIESSANQLQGEVHSNPKRAYSSAAQLGMAKERIEDLERGALFPFNVFLALRLWHRDPETVISRAALVRNAFAGLAGALCHHATNRETARQLWYQTWPGWTFGAYRGYDQETDDEVAACLVPWSSTFSGRLEDAEAIYDSPRGGLVGVSTAVGGVGQHFLVLGITRGGKSLWETDFLAQAGHEFGYVLIVEEGLSHAVTARTLGAEPIIVTPNGAVTINCLDPDGAPTSPEHLAAVVNLYLLMLREGGPKAQPADVSRLSACLSRHLNALYDQVWQQWAGKHPAEAESIARRAYGIYRSLSRMGGQGNTFLDGWATWRELERSSPEEMAARLAALDPGDVARFETDPLTRSLVRDLGLSYLAPEEAPTHGQFVELLTLNSVDEGKAAELAIDLGERLSAWSRTGPYGRLFDGVATHRLNGNAVHIDLTGIPDAMEEVRSAMYYLVLNVARQQVIKRPRAERKLVIYEEGARILPIPGGSQAISTYYTQMGKYGCTVGTMFQQLSALEAAEPAARAAILDNSKLFLVTAQPSRRATDEIAKALDLSPQVASAVRRYPMPEHQLEGQKFSSFLMAAPDPSRPLVGTFRNIVSPEVLYCGQSDKDVWDRRQQELSHYEDVVDGILKEARKKYGEK